MATEGLQIKVGADVKDAVGNLGKLNQVLRNVGIGLAAGAAGAAALALKAIVLDPLIGDLKKEFSDLQQNIVDSIDPMRKYTTAIGEVSGAVVKNAASVFQLVNALQSGTLSVEQTRLAQQKLVKEAPAFKDAFDKNGNSVKNLSDVLTNTYIPALINTIKINAANEIITKKLKASFDAIASSGETSALQKLGNGFKNIGLVFNTAGFFASEAGTKFKNFKEAQDALGAGNIQKLLEQTYKDLGISLTDFGLSLDNTGKSVKDHTTKIKEYKGALDGLISSYQTYLKQLEIDKSNTNDLIKLQSKLGTLRSSGGLTGGLSNPNDPSQKTTLKILDPSALNDLQNVDKLNEKLLNTKDLINNGLNAGIDQFFNAIANNQDPFKALAQSAARLVTELGAAVVKALLLKVITKAISGGIGGGADRALAGFGKGLSGGGAVRGDIMRLAMFR